MFLLSYTRFLLTHNETKKSKNFEFELSNFLKTHNIYLTINSLENEFIWKKTATISNNPKYCLEKEIWSERHSLENESVQMSPQGF